VIKAVTWVAWVWLCYDLSEWCS